jgi:hypothetical protein
MHEQEEIVTKREISIPSKKEKEQRERERERDIYKKLS